MPPTANQTNNTNNTNNHKPKLSPAQINEAYDLYYNWPKYKPRPTLQALAAKYNVSTNTMFVHLNREHERRQQQTQQAAVNLSNQP